MMLTPTLYDSGAPARHPRGMILMMALVILLLMSLMGMAILANTRTEMSIAANTVGGRDAFTRADTAARVATLMARLVVHEHELGSPATVLTGGPFTVELGSTTNEDSSTTALAPLNEASLLEESAEYSNYQLRYLATASRLDTTLPALRPHMVFRQDGKVVATARVSLDYNETLDMIGKSLGTGTYDNGSGTQLSAVLSVTTHGRPPQSGGDDFGAYDGTADPADADATAINDVPHSIITTLFREVLSK